MPTIAFIACSKSKNNAPCIAQDMYQGALFKKSLQYCIQEKFDQIYILSAKYGVLSLTDQIEPYELTLNTMNKEERLLWYKMVRRQLHDRKITGEFWFFTGSNYNEHFHGNKPLHGLSIGYMLEWFNLRLKPQNTKDNYSFNL